MDYSIQSYFTIYMCVKRSKIYVLYMGQHINKEISRIGILKNTQIINTSYIWTLPIQEFDIRGFDIGEEADTSESPQDFSKYDSLDVLERLDLLEGTTRMLLKNANLRCLILFGVE